uniref:trypsin n=1 Tax=Anopheles epiroticus TaxID=199890 RepID=A0A182PSE9_9DIPT
MLLSGTVSLLLLVVQLWDGVFAAITFDRMPPMAPIIGGTDLKDGMAPYLAALMTNGTFLCGGSIIDERWILTAAHCLSNITVNASVVRVGTNSYSKGGTKYLIDRAIPHEGSVGMFSNDIALLRLKIPLKFGKHVQKIQLSTKSVPINATVTIMGWGLINHQIDNPKVAQQAKVQHIGLDRCRKMQPAQHLTSLIYEDNLCTFSKTGQGVCHGDSGSPVVWNGRQVAVVIGVLVCCAVGNPDVHSSTVYHHRWIQKTIAANSY